MNLKKLIGVLAENQYNFAKNSNPQYLFFCRNSDEHFSAIILVDDVRYPQTNDPLVFTSIRESLEKTFLLRGYRNVDVLFVIFTKNPFAYKKFADSEFTFWVSDLNSGRIISYSDNDSAFDFIRNDLESCLTEQEEKPSLKDKFNNFRLSTRPVFTIFFALISIMVFFYMDLFGNLSDTTYIYNHGAAEWHSVLEDNEFYRLLTSMFIHFDFGHLFNNMISLFAVGSQLEPAIGHIKYTIIYILSGLAASMTSVLYHASTDAYVISAGASGAIFGLFGAYAVCSLFDMVKHKNLSFSRIAIISILMLYNGMANESVDNAAHLGGMIFGCIIAFICCICKKNKI